MGEWLVTPPQWIALIAAGLGGWRIGVLFVYEGGPFNVITWLRSYMGIAHDEDGNPYSWPEGLPGSLFRCVWCMFFWTVPLVYAILWAAPFLGILIAAWGVATYLDAVRPKDGT